jgi:hypothetical protein
MLWVTAGLALATAIPAVVVGSIAFTRTIPAPPKRANVLGLPKAKPVVKKAAGPKPVYKVPFGKSSGRPALRKSA